MATGESGDLFDILYCRPSLREDMGQPCLSKKKNIQVRSDSYSRECVGLKWILNTVGKDGVIRIMFDGSLRNDYRKLGTYPFNLTH